MMQAAMRRAFLLALGAGAGPLIQLLATPWLARVYLPSDFGALALFLSAAGVLVAIACLRYESVIVIADNDQISAAVWVSTASALLLFLVVLLFEFLGVLALMFPQLKALGRAVWWIPVYALCGGLILVGLQLTLRKGNFALNAVFRSGQSMVFVFLALLWNDIGLIAASVCGGVVVSVLVLGYLVKAAPTFSMSEMRRVARERRHHPLALTPTSLLDALAVAAPVVFLGGAYGAEPTGHYSQIQRLVGAPLVLVGLVVGQLFMRRSAEIYRSGQSSRQLLWRSVGMLSLAALILGGILASAGEYFLGWILGHGWRIDTPFIMLASAPLLCKLVVSPVSSVFITHDQIRTGVGWQLAYFASTFCVLYFASVHLALDDFLIVYAVHEFVLYGIYLFLAHRVAHKVRA